MAGACPEDMKAIMGRYLSRAQQLDSLAAKRPGTGAERVAYHCRVKALNMATTKGRDALSDAGNAAFVGALMDDLERQKASLGISPDASADDAAKAREFAMRYFEAAERDVAGGNVDAKTASRYWHAATLFDVIENILGELDDDLAARNIFAEQMTREVTAAHAAAASAAPAPAPPSGPVSLHEYVPIAGSCWSKEVIIATKECSLAATLLRADDIYGAQQHMQKALTQINAKIAEHESGGGSSKRL